MARQHINIIVTVQTDDEPKKTFAHAIERTTDDPRSAFHATVTGLETVLSKMHRDFFPTEEEAMKDAKKNNQLPPQA